MRRLINALLVALVFIQLHGVHGPVWVNVDDITTFQAPPPPMKDGTPYAFAGARTHLHLLNAESLFVTDTPEQVWTLIQPHTEKDGHHDGK